MEELLERLNNYDDMQKMLDGKMTSNAFQ